MNPDRFDLVILGGGCTGLSLARELSNILSWDQTTLIIEPRTNYSNDRSWCFWTPKDRILRQMLEPMIEHTWERWKFSGVGFSEIHTSSGISYCHISANSFYQHALSAISNKPNIKLHLGKKATEIKKGKSGFSIKLDNGEMIYTSKIIDTRPTIYRRDDQARIWQIFYGYEIETQSDCFDDLTVGLMEHLTPKPEATEFIYTLPFTKKRALIELTQFSRALYDPSELADPLKKYLEEHIGFNKFKILRSEYACLPMGLRSENRSILENYHYAGISAGAIRPATGYAFIRIQQWAKNCAHTISQRKKSIPIIASTKLVKVMDRIFLSVLHDKPSMGVALFQALAERVSGQSLARFLMDEAQAEDYYKVIMALPKLRFILYSLGLHYSHSFTR